MRAKLPEKLYYSIGEIADAFEVKTSLIRFWEKEFKILTPKKNTKGTRKFTSQDIDKIELIYFLVKEKGFTLEGAKKEIHSQKSNRYKIVRRLKSIRDRLVQIRENL